MVGSSVVVHSPRTYVDLHSFRTGGYQAARERQLGDVLLPSRHRILELGTNMSRCRGRTGLVAGCVGQSLIEGASIHLFACLSIYLFIHQG